MKAKAILKRTGKIAVSLLIYAVVALCLLGVLLTISAKKSEDGTMTIFGMQLRIVLTSSMEADPNTDVSDFDIKDIPVRSVVFVETVPDDPVEAKAWYAALKEGDVLTFRYLYNVMPETITHRIIDIDPDPETGGYVIQLKGDNKGEDGENLTQTIYTGRTNTSNRVIGKVVGQSYLLGLFLSVLREPIGIICMILIPAVAIAIWELVKIINILTSDKRRKAREESEAQQNEMEALKRRLAELEAAQAAQSQAPPPTQGSPPPEKNASENNSTSVTNGEEP